MDTREDFWNAFCIKKYLFRIYKRQAIEEFY